MKSRMRTAWALRFSCWLLAWVVWCPVQAHRLQDSVPAHLCPGLNLQVLAAHPADFQDACSGAQAALNFFTAHGFQVGQQLLIEVVDKLPEAAGPAAVACYLIEHQRILILSYEVFGKRQSWFEIPVSRELYRSLASHEVAHALAASNFAGLRPALQAQEYVAYAVMFATMNPDLRTRILQALPGTGFDHEIQITAIFYALDPLVFGVEAYRHFIKEDNGIAFLRLVFTGKALTDGNSR